MHDNFTFCAFSLGVSQQLKDQLADEILSVDDNLWYHDKFRNCYMLPIFNGGDVKNNTAKGELDYTEAGRLCPTVRAALEDIVFPFMEPNGRVTVLRTLPGHQLNVHLDSNENEIGTLQHKFRIALKGEFDKLYFLDKNLKKVYVPECYDTYVLDGSHPHAVDPGKSEKLTLCVGKPWGGEPSDLYNSYIEQYDYKMYVSRPQDILEEWTNPRWKR